MSKTYYMHTLDRLPAAFYPSDGQICFVTRYGKAPELAKSLRQIRREQQITAENRRKWGMEYNSDVYGYRRVSVPE